MNIKAFDMLIDLQCTVMHLSATNKISNKVYIDLNTEIQKIIDQMDIDGEIFKTNVKNSNINIDIEKYNTYIESHEIKGRGSCKTFKYNLDTILREYQTIISKMNYVPKITQIREEYEVNELKHDLIKNTNKLHKLIVGDKKDVL